MRSGGALQTFLLLIGHFEGAIEGAITAPFTAMMVPPGADRRVSGAELISMPWRAPSGVPALTRDFWRGSGGGRTWAHNDQLVPFARVEVAIQPSRIQGLAAIVSVPRVRIQTQ
jgi:hypothetical protein